jgi:hypothetical protein
MIEAAMIWNEPNNKSHWDFESDPGWTAFAAMASLAGEAIAAEAPGLPRVLGGISPIDPEFLRILERQGVMDHLDAVAVHGFPLDGACAAPPNCSSARPPGSIGTASTTCPPPGPPPPAIARLKDHPTTAISTWACSTNTAAPSWPPATSPISRLPSAYASGSISRIIVSTMR